MQRPATRMGARARGDVPMATATMIAATGVESQQNLRPPPQHRPRCDFTS
jgi:hypothetical protein